MKPKSVKQVFNDGYDVPAEELNFTVGGIWQVDTFLVALAELNLESSKVWQEMKSCSGNDTEATRKNYYLNQWSCPNAQEISQKLKEIKNNIENFFTTYPFPKQWTDEYELSATKLHPLFVQVIWEK